MLHARNNTQGQVRDKNVFTRLLVITQSVLSCDCEWAGHCLRGSDCRTVCVVTPKHTSTKQYKSTD